VSDLGLFDVIAPYLLTGADLGAVWHPIITTLFVDSCELECDDDAVVLSGVAKLKGDVQNPTFSITPQGINFGTSASVPDDHDPNQAKSNGAVFDWHDISVAFRMSARRRPSSTIVSAAALTTPSPTDPKLVAMFGQFGGTGGSTKSDYPDAQFRLDLMLTLCTLHLPFLVGAKLQSDGQIVADPANPDVALTLPKLLVTITQDSTGNLGFTLDSWGAETIDDPSDTGEAQLIQMKPPYALVGDGGFFGFGFDKAVLDLSDDHTPPELLSQFGVGDDWQGIYLPDLRVFFVTGTGGGSGPGTSNGIAWDIAAHDLLIGMGRSHGVSGDFSLDVVKRHDKPSVKVRFFAADGTAYDVDLTTGHGSAQLPVDTTMVVDVSNAYPPYQVTVDGSDITAAGQRQPVHLAGPHTFSITVKDGSQPAQVTTVTIDVQPIDSSLAATSVTTTQPGDPVLTPTNPTDGVHTIALVGKTQSSATLSFTPADNTLSVTVDGSAATLTNGLLSLALAAGDSHAIVATWTVRPAGTPRELRAWFHFNRPQQGATLLDSLPPLRLAAPPDPAGVPDFTDVETTTPAPSVSDQEDTGTGSQSVPFTSAFIKSAELQDFVAGLPDPANVTLHGFASWETPGKQQFNASLSERRAVAMARLISKYLDDNTISKNVSFSLDPLGNDQAPPKPPATPSHVLPNDESAEAYAADDPSGYHQRDYWLAYASIVTAAPDPTPASVTTTLSRGTVTTVTPLPAVNVPAPAGNVGQPAFFHSLHAIVRIAQNKFIACEIRLEVDFQTEAENRLQGAASNPGSLPPGGNLPANTNPDDGVVDFDLQISWDDQRQEIRIDGSAAASKNDKDGLWQLPKPNTPVAADQVFWRDLLGLEIVLMPLLASSGAAKPNVGSLAAMAVELAIPIALAGADWAHATTITLYGIEVVFDEQRGGPGQLAVLADIEVDVMIDISIGGVKILTTDHPIKVRYASVGVAVNFGNTAKPALQPVFDPSKGYTIDVGDPGSLKLPAPLDNIIQILGGRIARTNPLNLEVDLGLSADLGFVQVDRAKLRVPLDGGGPSITALGVTVDIPGAFYGRGYLNVNDDGSIVGSLDLMLRPIGLRIAAGIEIGHTPGGQTAVLIELEVDFPAPIVLGNSGLGIYGLLGLVAVHYQRNEDPNGQPTPALDWLINKAKGDPVTIPPPQLAWSAADDAWAFGAGLVIGTMDDGIVLNLKGTLIFELPGPRLLLFMNAKILFPRPPLRDNAQQGTIRAVIDIDFGRGTIDIGLQVDYGVDPLFHVTIPGDAFFDFNNPQNFALDLGKFPAPQVSVSIFDDFAASGYLMIHGNGLVFDGGTLDGFSIAVGFKVSLIWGDTTVGLYLKVTAGFYAGLSFSPFEIIGSVSVSGELRLFIVSIGASASLTVKSDGSVTTIDGDVCGEVDFLFFSVKGCVGFHLGQGTTSVAIPPLARGLALLGRSPALVIGTGTDIPIDAAIGQAVDPNDPNAPTPPVVPIDAVPVLGLDFTPLLDGGFAGASFVQSPGDAPGVPQGGWNRRGESQYSFTLKSITLSGPAPSGGSGTPPATWRARNPAPNGDDTSIDLALIDWVPQPNAKAVTSSVTLDDQVKHRWGELCTPVAPETSVLWTFQHSQLGPSATGWTLTGAAWPDPPGTTRSAPPNLTMKVWEQWRSGNPWLDAISPVVPAAVIDWLVACPNLKPPQAVGIGRTVSDIASTLPGLQVALPAGRDSVEVAQALQSLDHLTVAGKVAAATATPVVEASFRATPAALTGHPVLSQLVAKAPQNAPNQAPQVAVAPAPAPQCLSRVLSAPYEKPHAASGIDQLFKTLGGQPPQSDLGDLVLFKADPLTEVRLLLYVQTEVIRMRSLVLRAFDASGQKLSDQNITGAIVNTASQLPPHWTDPSGPWAYDVLLGFELLLVAAGAGTQTRNGFVLMADVKLPSSTSYFGLGLTEWPKLRALILPPSFYVAAIEGVSAAEGSRVTWDTTNKQEDVKRLEGGLAADPATLPLLAPNSTYDVSVTYTAQRKASDGTISPNTTPLPVTTQTFRFKTANAPPDRLDPYVLCISPAADEKHHFYQEPIVVVFGTDAITQLYGAYGVTLQGIARAGTLRPPPSSPNAAKTKAPLAPLQKIKTGAVQTPFDEAIKALTQAQPSSFACINVSNETTTLGSRTFDLYLEPATPYIFDIEDPTATATTHPLFRSAFETSRYPTWQALALDVHSARIEARHVAAGSGAAIDGLPANPTAAQLETVLQTCGLGAVPVPFAPRVIVFWQDALPKAQPIAVLIDAPEALRRSRPEPTPVPGPPQRPAEYRNNPRIFLDVVGSAPIGQVRASPSGARVLVRLLPGALGATSQIQLQRTDIDPLTPTWAAGGPTEKPWALTVSVSLVDLDLRVAPWEA
jgi:large repetitive protein